MKEVETMHACFVLIDDDRVANLLTGTVIKRHVPTPNLIEFTLPAEGLQFLRSNTEKAIVLLDINMPKLSGWDVLDALQKEPASVTSQLSIYMLSSSIDPDDKARAQAHPLVQGYIEKPLTDAVLLRLL